MAYPFSFKVGYSLYWILWECLPCVREKVKVRPKGLQTMSFWWCHNDVMQCYRVPHDNVDVVIKWAIDVLGGKEIEEVTVMVIQIHSYMCIEQVINKTTARYNILNTVILDSEKYASNQVHSQKLDSICTQFREQCHKIFLTLHKIRSQSNCQSISIKASLGLFQVSRIQGSSLFYFTALTSV